ncbi:TPA: transcriptional regulator [Yersinia enterocolitica]
MNHVIEKAIDIAGSQSELAKRVGVGQSTISKWLGGAEISSRYISALELATGGEISTLEILESLKPSDDINPISPAA